MFRGNAHKQSGLTLLELLIASALTAILLLGYVAVMDAGSRTSLAQDDQSRQLESTRQATDLLQSALRQAGFSPRPWDSDYDLDNPFFGSGPTGDKSGDRLVITSWSDLNCFNYRNPDKDSEGLAKFYLRQQQFDVSTTAQLAVQCRYGPSVDAMVTQIRRQGRVPGISAMQVLAGLDADEDGYVEQWQSLDDSISPSRIRGARINFELNTASPANTKVEFVTAIRSHSG